MAEDVVRRLGYLTLGSRFRRIGERLQADTQQIVERCGVKIQPAQYPYIAAIDRLGPLTIGDMAEALGVTQPGVTRTVVQLVKLGLVTLQTSDEDQRKKVISLTPAGHELVAFSKEHVWPRIEDAVADLCAGLDGPLLLQLAEMEERLAKTPLVDRSQEKGSRK